MTGSFPPEGIDPSSSDFFPGDPGPPDAARPNLGSSNSGRFDSTQSNNESYGSPHNPNSQPAYTPQPTYPQQPSVPSTYPTRHNPYPPGGDAPRRNTPPTQPSLYGTQPQYGNPPPGIPQYGAPPNSAPPNSAPQYGALPAFSPQQTWGSGNNPVGSAKKGGAKKVLLIVGLLVLLLFPIGGGGWFLYVKYVDTGNPDEDQIRSVSSEFAAAVDTEDQDTMLKLMCQEEATGFIEDDDYDPDNSDRDIDAEERPFEVTGIEIKDNVAAVDFLRSDTNDSGTLYMRKEEDTWKVCDPAEANFK